jgi:hypothetical protein
MQRSVHHLLAATMALAATACGDTVGPICDGEPRANFRVEVRDSLTGWGMADEVTGSAAGSGITIGLVPVDTLHLTDSAPADRRGTYDITLTAAGYAPWHVQGVTVTGDACHVTTIELAARMQPAAEPEFVAPSLQTVSLDTTYEGPVHADVRFADGLLRISGRIRRTNTCFSPVAVATRHGRVFELQLTLAPKGFDCVDAQQWLRYEYGYDVTGGRYRVTVHETATTTLLADTIIRAP